MLTIDFENFYAHKVERYNGTYIIGRILDSEGNTFTAKEVYLLFLKCREVNDILEIVREFHGHFAIVYQNKSEIYVIQDIIRSIPIFYLNERNSLIITNDPYKYSKLPIKDINHQEFLAACYISGNRTLFSNINQVEAGCWLCAYNSNGEFYYKYGRYTGLLHKFSNANTNDIIVSDLDAVYNSVFKGLINYLKGRRVVIPLSGGHDSRLILYYLCKNEYKNITTFSYGWENNYLSEGSVSENVAKYLGVEYRYIPYRKNDIMKMIKEKKRYMNILLYGSMGTSFPHLQDWYAIDYLTTNELIPKDSVIIPGHAGDFIAGSHIKLKHTVKEEYSLGEIITDIIDKHYYHYPWWRSNRKNKEEIFHKIVFDNIPSEFQKEKLSKFEAVRLMELYNYKERQAKMIANSVRVYEFYNYEWYLPLWDKDIVEFWSSIPIEKLFERKLFKEFVNSTYPGLMKAAPIYEKKNSDRIAKKIESNDKKETIKKLFSKSVLFYKAFINRKAYDSINLLSYISNFKILKSIVLYNSINIDFLWLNELMSVLIRENKISNQKRRNIMLPKNKTEKTEKIS